MLVKKPSLFCSEILYLGKLQLNVVQMHWQESHEGLSLSLIEAVVVGLLGCCCYN